MVATRELPDFTTHFPTCQHLYPYILLSFLLSIDDLFMPYGCTRNHASLHTQEHCSRNSFLSLLHYLHHEYAILIFSLINKKTNANFLLSLFPLLSIPLTPCSLCTKTVFSFSLQFLFSHFPQTYPHKALHDTPPPPCNTAPKLLLSLKLPMIHLMAISVLSFLELAAFNKVVYHLLLDKLSSYTAQDTTPSCYYIYLSSCSFSIPIAGFFSFP